MRGLHPACYQWIWAFKANTEARCCLSVFCYTSVPKRRRTSELRAARKDREDLLSSLLSEPPQSDPEPLPEESETSSSWDLSEPNTNTKDAGVQCG